MLAAMYLAISTLSDCICTPLFLVQDGRRSFSALPNPVPGFTFNLFTLARSPQSYVRSLTDGLLSSPTLEKEPWRQGYDFPASRSYLASFSSGCRAIGCEWQYGLQCYFHVDCRELTELENALQDLSSFNSPVLSLQSMKQSRYQVSAHSDP